MPPLACESPLLGTQVSLREKQKFYKLEGCPHSPSLFSDTQHVGVPDELGLKYYLTIIKQIITKRIIEKKFSKQVIKIYANVTKEPARISENNEKLLNY